MNRREHQLWVVGSGICAPKHMTLEVKNAIERADKVFYVVAGKGTADFIRQLNPSAESLGHLYDAKTSRADTYQMMVDVIVGHLYVHRSVCAVFYGHPGVLVNPGHEAVRRAKREGFKAAMLPAISAEDCLYADLGIDPVENSCQTYGANAFILARPTLDSRSALILWQIGAIGELSAGYLITNYKPRFLDVLAEVLSSYYAPSHQVAVYQAAATIEAEPEINWTPISSLPHITISTTSTLYVPPLHQMTPQPEMLIKLGLKSIEE